MGSVQPPCGARRPYRRRLPWGRRSQAIAAARNPSNSCDPSRGTPMPTDFNGPNGSQHPLRFGIFLPPMHPTGQNPTLSIRRDVELIQHLDRLGFDEAWIGEHHSSGYETIASPEVFIAHIAALTEHIKLGTGVSSLPYHHPLILADRILLLDHLTRGRTMFGVGPGQLASDAAMLGITVDHQRRMMEESFDVIMAPVPGRDGDGEDRLVHDRRGSAAAAAVLELRHRRRRVDLAVGPEARRSLRRRPAVGGGDEPGRFREPGRALEGDGGAGRRGRPRRGPVGVADDGPDAHRRHRGAGARGLPSTGSSG